MSDKSIKLIIGYPASGKTRYARTLEEKGYFRLNRDDIGGKLSDLVNHLNSKHYSEGVDKFVLDNTYATKQQRYSVLQWAKKNDFDIDCYWIAADVADSQFNVVKRFYDSHGNLILPEHIKSKKDPGVYPPAVIFRYRKIWEKPTLEEGFNKIKKIPFNREIDKDIYINRAIILDYDGTLRKTKSGAKYPLSTEDVEILPNRTSILKKYMSQGYKLLGVSNQSGVAKNDLTKEEAVEIFQYTNQLLDVDIDFKFCPHPAFPQICYCRKPIPGMGVVLIEQYKLDPSQCIMVGDMRSDETFARRLGFSFIHADKFFEKQKFRTLDVF